MLGFVIFCVRLSSMDTNERVQWGTRCAVQAIHHLPRSMCTDTISTCLVCSTVAMHGSRGGQHHEQDNHCVMICGSSAVSGSLSSVTGRIRTALSQESRSPRGIWLCFYGEPAGGLRCTCQHRGIIHEGNSSRRGSPRHGRESLFQGAPLLELIADRHLAQSQSESPR